MPDPNNVALRDCGVVFMLLPKIANTSIKLAILKAYGRPTDKIHVEGVFECVGTAEAKKFPHRIAFVRDPLDRLASCYVDKFVVQSDGHFIGGRSTEFRPNMGFAKFVEAVALTPDENASGWKQHFRSIAYSLCDGETVIPNVVGRFETLAADWARVQKYVQDVGGPVLPELTHERKTNHKPASYDARSRSFALHRYAADVRIFGYQPPRKYEIDPDRWTRGRSICNVQREAYRIARDRVKDPQVAQRLMELMAEAFDMGKRMNAQLGGSQYES